MRDVDLKIEKVRTDELLPYYNNAKKHPREQVNQIAKSIEEFGNCDPIAVWTNAKGDYEIVEGHGRLMALDQLGIKEAPVIFLDHLSDEQRRQYTHVHNQLTMNSDFDLAILDEEFDAMPDFEWDAFGFDFSTIEEEIFEDPIEEKEVRPYKYAHFMITIDSQDTDKIIPVIDELRAQGFDVVDSIGDK